MKNLKFINILVLMLFASNGYAQLSIFAGAGAVVSLPSNRIYTTGGPSNSGGYHETYDGASFNYSVGLGALYKHNRHVFMMKTTYLNSSIIRHSYYYEYYAVGSNMSNMPNIINQNLVENADLVKIMFLQIPISYGYSIIDRPNSVFSLTPYVGWVNQFCLNGYNLMNRVYIGSAQTGIRLKFKYLFLDFSDIIRVTNRNSVGGSFNILNFMFGVTYPLSKKSKSIKNTKE